MTKISIIIPTYNEANNLPLLLSDLIINKEELEILVVDSGSEDSTINIAKIYGAKIHKAKEKNRGLQLNLGAMKAKGEWFVFVHADSRFDDHWFERVKANLAKNKNFYIYFFKFKVNNKRIIYRFLEVLVNIRSLFFKKPYGDQGLIIHKKTYFENNGYKKIPLMEDLDFLERLNKNDLKLLDIPIYTSSRKWEKTNFFIQAFKNWNLRRRWSRGDSIESIYFDYYNE